MKYSHNWLKKHIGGAEVPSAKDIEAALTMHAFEVEEVVELGHDSVLDIKVLPDRSHDALSHVGMAREIVSLYNSKGDFKLVKDQYKMPEPSLTAPKFIVEDAKACLRFMGITIRNIKIKESDAETKALLEAIGQKSINNIVDATNYVLYDLGKPMHVFDADKVVGTIIVRFAKQGEELTTLDGKNIKLDESILVIADEAGPLSIAGIKGGTRAEVDPNTTSIVIESANFNGTLLRKTSNKLSIKTDAVKRFENGITSELCEEALYATAGLILASASTEQTEISNITDIYPKKEVRYKVGVSTSEINKVLGTELADDRVAGLLKQRGFDFKKVESVLEEIVRLSKEFVGITYKRGASVLYDAPNSFDCSSFTAYLYKEMGIAIPRVAVDQYVFSYKRDGAIQPGDLLFINSGVQKSNGGTYYSQVLGKDVAESAIRYESLEWMPGTKVPNGVDHVAMYIGEGYIVHATTSAGKVVHEKLDDNTLFKDKYEARYVVSKDEPRFVVTVPFERLDIRNKEDLIDEVGKLVGTADIFPTTKYEGVPRGAYDKIISYTSAIRALLLKEGFSQVMTYSFAEDGDIAILNSVDPKKNKLRNTIVPGIASALEKALYYSPFLGEDTIKMFETGRVFTEDGEKLSLTVGIGSKNKKIKKQIEADFQKSTEGGSFPTSIVGLSDLVDTNNSVQKILNTEKGFAVIEFHIEKDILEVENNIGIPYTFENKEFKYQTLSNYPFITRDVAVFMPVDEKVEDLEGLLTEEAGSLCVKLYQFDKYHKEGEDKFSYGYRLVFQSFDKTLTDNEVEPVMSKVYQALASKKWEVR